MYLCIYFFKKIAPHCDRQGRRRVKSSNIIQMKKSIFFSVLTFLMASCDYNPELSDYQFENGDVIPIVPTLTHNVDSIRFYWDDQYETTLFDMPFIYYRKLQNESSGKHEIKYVSYYTKYTFSNDGTIISSQSSTFQTSKPYKIK